MAQANPLPRRGFLPAAEPYGLEPVPLPERKARPGDVFWVWFSANLALTYVVLGAGLWGYGLSFGQVLLVTALGTGSYALLGYMALPGARHGLPTMALGAYAMGRVGNIPASLVSWMNLVGWETVVLVVSAQALAAAFHLLTGLPLGVPLSLAGLAITVVLVFGTAFLGYHAVVAVQRAFAYVFGILTALSLALALPHLSHPWAALPHHTGPWLTGVLPAFAVVASACGLSWVNTGADYARYLPPPGREAFAATTWGSWLPAAALVLVGAFLALGTPGLATATNPVAALERLVPTWFAVPYLLAAAGGMITGDILDVYSGGLSLLAAGVRLPRSRTVLADLVVSVALAGYALWGQHAFLPLFESFLTLLASMLAPWAAVYLAQLTDLEEPHLTAQPPPAWRAWPTAAWVLGVATGLLTASSPLWSGPLARGVLQGSDLGLLLAFAVSWTVAWMGRRWRKARG